MKKRLLHILILTLIITSCGTYKSGTIFGGGFYGKNKVIETDHPEKIVIEPEVDLTENNAPETIEYETTELEPEYSSYPETFSPTGIEKEEEGLNHEYQDEFNPEISPERGSFPDYENDKKSKTEYKDVPPDESDDKAVRIILLVLLGFMLLVFLFGLTVLIIFLVLIL